MVAFLTRRYAEVVEVFRADDAPAHFVWRGRHYTVREVLTHWVRTGAWWQSSAVTRITGTAEDSSDDAVAALELRPLPPSPRWGQRAWGEPAPDVGVSIGAEIDDDEREFWRVEASIGRGGATAVLDLCFAISTGVWTVESVMD